MPIFTDLCKWYIITVTWLCEVLNMKYKPLSNSFPFPFAWQQVFHSWHTTTVSSKRCYAALHTAQSHTQEGLCLAACYSSPSSWKNNKMCQHFIFGHCRVSTTLTFTSQMAVSLSACWQNSNETTSTLPLSRYPSMLLNHTSDPATTLQITTTLSLSTPSSILITHVYMIHPTFQCGYSFWTTRLFRTKALWSFERSRTTFPMTCCHIPEVLDTNFH